MPRMMSGAPGLSWLRPPGHQSDRRRRAEGSRKTELMDSLIGLLKTVLEVYRKVWKDIAIRNKKD